MDSIYWCGPYLWGYSSRATANEVTPMTIESVGLWFSGFLIGVVVVAAIWVYVYVQEGDEGGD